MHIYVAGKLIKELKIYITIILFYIGNHIALSHSRFNDIKNIGKKKIAEYNYLLLISSIHFYMHTQEPRQFIYYKNNNYYTGIIIFEIIL